MDFVPTNRTITFGPLDSEACTNIPIVRDTLDDEISEDFEVVFSISDEDIGNVSSKVTEVTIIDNGSGGLLHDCIILFLML